MNKFTTAFKAFIADENGVTAIEYGLLASIIGLALVAGAGALGSGLETMFGKIVGNLMK